MTFKSIFNIISATGIDSAISTFKIINVMHIDFLLRKLLSSFQLPKFASVNEGSPKENRTPICFLKESRPNH